MEILKLSNIIHITSISIHVYIHIYVYILIGGLNPSEKSEDSSIGTSSSFLSHMGK